ncbi:hypothetical protein [Tahibacter sp.]|uniref:hypothetical protein n=1 Tax=Tahibacter sp. TaxID=2056211 RepID=UPI0028C4A97E|nr:hypothetical protein [Tahibacter sp.]
MRAFTNFADDSTRSLLGILADKSSSEELYRSAMGKLGEALAEVIAREFATACRGSVYLVCTVEDADFLARGLLEGLLATGVDSSQVRFACFWNERSRKFTNSDIEAFDIAPIVKQYKEPVDVSSTLLIMVKSIISGACVVKTNLSTLVEKAIPQRVIVAAPVMVRGSKDRLASEFSPELAGRFEYVTFALDDPATGADHLVEPGIGGSVYKRLGMENKASYVPDLVKRRRRSFSATA